MSLKSSEDVTRFLRSKNEGVESLLSVANDVHDCSLRIFLPQKDIVLLDWLLEKLVSNSKFRVNVESWKLFNSIFNSLDGKADSRLRTFKNYNFPLILINTLKEVKDGLTKELLVVVTDCLKSLSNAYVNIISNTNDVSQVLILQYLNCILENHDGDLVGSDSFVEFTNQLLNALNQSFRGLKFSTKNSIATGNSILAVIIILLSLELESKSINLFISSVIPVVCIPEISIANSIKEAMNRTESGIIGRNGSQINLSSGLASLYTTVSSLENRKSLSDEYFKEVIQNYPLASPILLQIALDRGIKIEESVIKNLLINQLDSPHTRDWNIVKFILQIDNQIVHESEIGEKLYKAIEVSDSASLTDVAISIVKANSQPRDMPSFFTNWKNSLILQRVWKETVVIQEITKALSSLSAHQITSLIKEFESNDNKSNDNKNDGESNDDIKQSSKHKKRKTKFHKDDEDEILPLITLLKSLSPDKVIRIKESLMQIITFTSSWKIKFLIMSLTPDFVSNDTLSSSDGLDYFWSVFRVAEIHFIHLDKVIEELFKYLAKKKKYIPQFLSLVTSRWLFLVNKSFSKPHITQLIKLYIDDSDNLLELATNPYTYEQPNITSTLVSSIIEELQNKNRIKAITKALEKFPIDVFNKTTRQLLLDILVELEGDSKKSTQLSIRSCMKLLLKRPTYSSNIEQDSEIIYKLFLNNNSTLEEVTREICKSVITHHQLEETEQSKEFIASLITKVQGKSDYWSLKLSSIICTISSVEDKFQKKFIKSITKFTSKKNEEDNENYEEELSTLLEYLLPVIKQNPNSYLQLKAILGEKITKTENKGLIRNSFNILCLITKEINDLKSLTALYITINDEDINEYFSYSIKLFKTEDVINLLDEIIIGCTDNELFDACYKTITIYGISLPPDERLVKLFTKLFALLLNHDITCEESLISFLNLINTLLKEKPMVISQHGLELILSIVFKITSIRGPSFETKDPSSIYIKLTRIISSILLFHRHRINGRHHLITQTFISLLKCLCKPIKSLRQQTTPKWVHSMSSSCAIAYSRLLSNLCEPPTQSIRERGGNLNLTSSATVAKKAISKHISAILGCYINLTLQVGFVADIRINLRQGFYPIFDILGDSGLKTATSFMDSSSRGIFKSLYDDYRANGIWKED